MATEATARQDVIEACRALNSTGLSNGTSGNVSVRHEDLMLISPSAVPYDALTPELVAAMDLSGDMVDQWTGPAKPSTEWRFHWKLLQTRADLSAIVHAHPPFCTALAILRQPIPACHYMIAAFGGTDVRCAGYHRFGSEELAEDVVTAMTDRTACLLANHGMVAGGLGVEQAMWRAVELETLAQQYCLATQTGTPVILSDTEVADAARGFSTYGVQGQEPV